MKRTFKTIAIIATMGIMLVGAFELGTMQVKTITVLQTVEKEVEKPIRVIPQGYVDTTSEDFYNNYVDMRTVVDFEATEEGLQLYTSDGSGYYWER